jgi:hypothetical protein
MPRRTALCRRFQLFRQLLDATFDVGLQMIGAFVLRNRTQHFAQQIQPFPRIPRLAIAGFGCLVLG